MFTRDPDFQRGLDALRLALWHALNPPTPALAIISTIDNDIRCDGTDPGNIGRFGMNVEEALEVITTASPDTRILVVGQLGRPSPDFV